MVNIEEQFKQSASTLKLLHRQRNDTIDLLKNIVDAISYEETKLSQLSVSLCKVDQFEELFDTICNDEN